MPRRSIQLTSANVGARFNSNVKVYDARTFRLKRIEAPDGKILINFDNPGVIKVSERNTARGGRRMGKGKRIGGQKSC